MGDGGALNGDPLARELSGAGRKSADQAQVGEWPRRLALVVATVGATHRLPCSQ